MPTVLARNALVLATLDDERREIADGALFTRDGVIEQVGTTAELPERADVVLDLAGHVVLPGLVNTHHHLYQTLTRALAPDADLFTWLRTLYPIWGRLTDEGVYVSTLAGLAELLLSGCTTSSDHLYIFPNDCTLDAQVRAAREIGARFHAARGSMSLGQSRGGLPPDRLVEDEEAILRDCERLIGAYHDPARHAMLRIVLAPCSPFTVSADLMRQSAALARRHGVRLHTHLAETPEEEAFCIERFGMPPVDYAESLGWLGEDAWHAHCVHLGASEIDRFAATGTGVAHCPSSNMRLASGIAPVPAMRAADVSVGLGVDGSASNDGSHMLAEARAAMLLARTAPDPRRALAGEAPRAGNPGALGAREALELATRGGAAALGRDDIGHLAAGMSADFIAIDTRRIGFAGALHDPVAACVLCQPPAVDVSVIDGRVVVEDGVLTTLDLEPVRERHLALSARMLRGD